MSGTHIWTQTSRSLVDLTHGECESGCGARLGWVTGREDGWERGRRFTCQGRLHSSGSPTSNTTWGVRKDQPNLPICDPFVGINQAGSRTGSNPRLLRGQKEWEQALFSTGESAGAQVTRGNEVIHSLGLASNKLP